MTQPSDAEPARVAVTDEDHDLLHEALKSCTDTIYNDSIGFKYCFSNYDLLQFAARVREDNAKEKLSLLAEVERLKAANPPSTAA